MFDLTEAFSENFEGFEEYVKKPIPIKAVKINLPEGFVVKTLEGTMSGKPGDYLVIGIRGERYICDGEIFEESYEKVIKQGE